jgi:MFS family permease
MIFSIGPEALITSLALLVAVVCPQLGRRWFSKAEHALAHVARHRKISVILCGGLALLLRAAILPILPVPIPHIHDEFSYLLAADTFAHGRLTNPTPPMWIHFETLHVIFTPTYASMYQPMQGLFLAAGQVITGQPFWGVWLSVDLMGAAICWMLQAWVPPLWALIGGLIPVLRFGVFSWAESYWGGAAPALGGALVLGALPRIRRHQRVRDSLIMALGIGILANSRPFEGFLLAIAALGVLLVWILGRQASALPWQVRLLRIVLPLGCGLVVVLAMTGFYFWRVTGSPFRMPYQLNRDMYSMGRYFYWQSPHTVPVYHHDEMRRFYLNEFKRYDKGRTLAGFLWEARFKLGLTWIFYVGPVLTIPFFMLPWALRDRRLRGLLITIAVSVAGMGMVIYFAPHYAAPLTCVILAFLVQALRHLRVWNWDGRPVGPFLARATILICMIMVPVQVFVLWARNKSPGWRPEGLDRQEILEKLDSHPGQQLVLVRYRPDHDVLSEEWVDNGADFNHSKVIWARDMGLEQNLELLQYYPQRTTWLVCPDETPPLLLRYDGGFQSCGSQSRDSQVNEKTFFGLKASEGRN